MFVNDYISDYGLINWLFFNESICKIYNLLTNWLINRVSHHNLTLRENLPMFMIMIMAIIYGISWYFNVHDNQLCVLFCIH